jgi:NADH dehydrogenase (ubiquinone) Fe-S protein 1
VVSFLAAPPPHALPSDTPTHHQPHQQGHHGDRGAARADVVLPSAAYTEKAGTYVNFEGRVQATRAAVPLCGDAREDWKVLRALSEVARVPLPYDSREQLLGRLAELAPHLGRKASVEAPVWLNGQYIKALQASKQQGSSSSSSSDVLRSPIENFYMTDAISRASQTMAKCVQARQQQQALKA